MAWPNSALTVNGLWNAATIRATQTYLARFGWYTRNIDGVEGHHTRVAMQQWIKAQGYYPGLLDGDLGPMFTRGLVEYLTFNGGIRISNWSGTFPVGIIVQSLQTYLNKNR